MSKQIYAVCCYTCEHNGQETCKGCNTILNGENEPYENWELREDLFQKDKKIAILQLALKKAVEDKLNAENFMFEKVFGKGAKLAVPKKEQWYLEQAKKEIKGE